MPVNSNSNQRILAVDLDGTLLRSDMLHETFWDAFAKDCLTPLRCVIALSKGKAELKRFLAKKSDLDFDTLPFDDQVIEYIVDWRKKGGRTALVTASDEILAKAISEHLNIFDEVHGSDGVKNLVGSTKAEFLSERFSKSGFVYMGDSKADLPVWKKAAHSVTINVSNTIENEVQSSSGSIEHLKTKQFSVSPYIDVLRPHQWLKNVLVFLPLLAAHQADSQKWIDTGIAFASFCLIASSVYVLNDLLDLKSDRKHTRKRWRSIASGNIPIAHCFWLLTGLLVLGFGLAAMLGSTFFFVMVAYYGLTSTYSLYIKRQIVLDIFVLSALYATRIVAGGAAADVPLSEWLLAFSIFFFFSLAAIKRQAELVDMQKQNKSEASGRGYVVGDLQLVSQFAIASGYVSVLVLALYIRSPTVLTLYKTPLVLWGICFVLLYWITYLVMVTHRGKMNDDPLVFAALNPVSNICLLIVLACALGGAML